MRIGWTFVSTVTFVLITAHSAIAETLTLERDLGVQGKYRRCKYSDGKVYGLPKTLDACYASIQKRQKPEAQASPSTDTAPPPSSDTTASDPNTGSQLVGTFTITGYQDANGKQGSDFQGCDYDRIIIFDDSKTLECTSYQYSYSYRPTATVVRNGPLLIMIVNGLEYQMRRPTR